MHIWLANHTGLLHHIVLKLLPLGGRLAGNLSTNALPPDVKFLNDGHLVATSWSKSFYSLRGENLIRHRQTVGMADQEVDENIS